MIKMFYSGTSDVASTSILSDNNDSTALIDKSDTHSSSVQSSKQRGSRDFGTNQK